MEQASTQERGFVLAPALRQGHLIGTMHKINLLSYMVLN